MTAIRSSFLLLYCIFLISACNNSFLPVTAHYNDYQIGTQLPKDSLMLQLLQPYSDSVNSNMNEIIGRAEKTLVKKQPEGSLGNFMADAVYYAAKEKFSIPVDAAFINNGGVRLTQLAAGPVTRGKIFELMPFDNLLIIQQMKGDVLQQFLDLVAQKDGWPIAGMTMTIQNKKAINIQIGGKPLDKNKIYAIANSDYIANGGDDAIMLKNIPQQNKGYLIRDAIFNYIKLLNAQGKSISAKEENRVTNAQ